MDNRFFRLERKTLSDAIISGDHDTFNQVLAFMADNDGIDGFTLNPYDRPMWYERITLLDIAVTYGQFEMARELIAKGANIDGIIERGVTIYNPLILNEETSLERIKMLIDLGANLGIQQCTAENLVDPIQFFQRCVSEEVYNKSQQDILDYKSYIELLEKEIGYHPYAKERIPQICSLLRKHWKYFYYKDSLVDTLEQVLNIKVGLNGKKNHSWKLFCEKNGRSVDLPKHPIFGKIFTAQTEAEIDITMGLIESKWKGSDFIRFGEVIAWACAPYVGRIQNFTNIESPLLVISDKDLYRYLSEYNPQKNEYIMRC